MFFLVHELIRDLDLQEQSSRVDLIRRSRLLMLACLLQIRTIERAVERHLALLATALRTDAAMYCRTKALFFSDFADDAAQSGPPTFIISSNNKSTTESQGTKIEKKK